MSCKHLYLLSHLPNQLWVFFKQFGGGGGVYTHKCAHIEAIAKYEVSSSIPLHVIPLQGISLKQKLTVPARQASHQALGIHLFLLL